MSDLISRQDAMEKYKSICEMCGKREKYNGAVCKRCIIDDAIDIVKDIPSAEPDPEEFEWCHDCKEYDQEKHCCHRWTKVIRQTIEELKAQTPETIAIVKNFGHPCGVYGYCSNCGGYCVNEEPYCPHCGARLEWE